VADGVDDAGRPRRAAGERVPDQRGQRQLGEDVGQRTVEDRVEQRQQARGEHLVGRDRRVAGEQLAHPGADQDLAGELERLVVEPGREDQHEERGDLLDAEPRHRLLRPRRGSGKKIP
jgi:hypothetical protein